MLKRTVLLILAIVCLMIGYTACADEEILLSEVTEDGEYLLKYDRRLRMNVTDGYKVLQGSATDGTYGYYFVLDQTGETELCTIHQIDLSTYAVQRSVRDLPLEHANGATWNPHTNQLIVANCKPTRNRLTMVDCETLGIVGTHDLPIDVLSVAYCAERDQYVVGHYDNLGFSVLDGSFNVIASYHYPEGVKHNQDAACDADYIYLLQWKTEYITNLNYVHVYTWNGDFVKTIDVKSTREIESMFMVDGKIYLGFYSTQPDIGEGRLLRLP